MTARLLSIEINFTRDRLCKLRALFRYIVQ